MEYSQFQYLFPPRPDKAFPPSELSNFEGMGSFLAQPKLNGSCCLIFFDGKKLIIKNRHREDFRGFQIEEELKKILPKKGWTVLVGEYLNKSKKDHSKKVFNHQYCIFDILVYQSEYLLGKTLEERLLLLEKLFVGEKSPFPYLRKISSNIYRMETISQNFQDIYHKITPIDVYEGIVLKRKNAPLKLGTHKNINSSDQLKCRKKTKNYSF